MLKRLAGILRRIRFCRSTAGLPAGTVVVFPLSRTRLCCGLAGIVEVVEGPTTEAPEVAPALQVVEGLSGSGLAGIDGRVESYAGGEESLGAIDDFVAALRSPRCFPSVFRSDGYRASLADLSAAITGFVDEETRLLDEGYGLPELKAQETVNRRLVRLRDAAWTIREEVLENVDRVAALAGDAPSDKALREYRKANLILNAVDRMEIRGRDSAGILFQVTFPEPRIEGEPREGFQVSDDRRTATFSYKVAAEVGKLGDNVAALRESVFGDDLLRELISDEDSQVLVMAHTRWASNGIINVENCHPLDNACAGETEPIPLGEDHPESDRAPRIHVALNGDIDNYLELRRRFEEATGRRISSRVTTDAKIIALWIDYYLRRGESLSDAFRLAVADFEGSAAVTMCSDLAPGRLFLSLRGSGQSLYVGVPESGFVVASEIYGLVEEDPRFLKLEGERERVPGDETTRGQVFVLDAGKPTGTGGVLAFHHDGVAVEITDEDVKRAEITTRDVDRGDFSHYFLKEVSQSSGSVAKTLRGKFSKDGLPMLGPETIPGELAKMLEDRSLARIYVVGQGTAAVAAMAAAAFIDDSLRGAGIVVEAMKASELSGFWLEEDMSKTLVIAVTQSGATADTNRAVDLARERGALTLAIVNRRNSDITFKTAGVLYTSDGRDVEMSVASTKAFYSQVVAGALLGLAFGRRAGTMGEARVLRELEDLRKLPRLLSEVFALGPVIARAAERHAPTRRYWTVVGSGPNRIAAEEVRIKLSELCYKSISADSVEDKKHIDLSSESMILVLAAGNNDSVLSDLAKDVAIFKAHRAIPIVLATKGDTRFAEYAAEVIELPAASPLLSMVTCTMAGHLFGYYAASAIDEGGKFLGRIRSVVVGTLDRPDVSALRDLGRYQREYRERLRAGRFASALEADTAAELILLLKYAAGEIPPVSFAEEYGREPGATEIHAALLECLVDAIDQTARPIDAIKHQAKIVTVGTSRPSERPSGVVFDALAAAGVPVSAVTFADRALMSAVQGAVSEVTGMTRYVLEDGDNGDAVLRATERTGTAAGVPSRADNGSPLKGTKRAVVMDRRAFVGVGTKDDRRIAILPLVDHRFRVNALVLLHLRFKEQMALAEKRRALGDRYDEIVNGVTESDVSWSDDLLEDITPDALFTLSAAQIAESIVFRESQ